MAEILRDQVIEGRRIGPSVGKVTHFGPGLVLDRCEFASPADGRGMTFRGVEMRGGQFRQEGELRNFQFDRVSFDGVRFEGAFVGCDFGGWEEGATARSCDFASTDLHDCRFINCDVDTITFPRWPCFVILDPAKARSFFLAREWPKGLATTLDVYTDIEPMCRAVVGNAEVIAKKAGLPLDEISRYLTTVPGLRVFR